MFVFLVNWLWVDALCFGPFIIIRRDKYSQELLNHEYIHFCQQWEMLFVFAYVLYVLEFIVKLLWYRNATTAYINISFEREARGFQRIIGYASHRKPYAFRHLIYVKRAKKKQ